MNGAGAERPAVLDTSPAERAFGHWLFTREVTFLRGVTKTSDLPVIKGAECAFAGRSNAGKSSLINALTGRRTVARVSNTPGRTREINFFDLGRALTIADLPGYGYAEAGRKLSAQWTVLIFDYLRGRPGLTRVFLLTDSRHGLKANDLEAMKLLDEAAVSYQLVLTKTDKISAHALAEVLSRTAETAAKHPAAHPVIVPTSSETGAGIETLRAFAAGLVPMERRAVLGYKP